jgi:hypothetical protein
VLVLVTIALALCLFVAARMAATKWSTPDIDG